jgi:hypothetical protein
VLLTASVAVLAQAATVDLETLWRDGDFARTRELITTQFKAGDRDPGFLSQAGQAADAIRDYELAAQVYSALAQTSAPSTNTFREAKQHEWIARWQAGDEDAQAAWITGARAEVQQLLAASALRGGTERMTALELEFALAQLTQAATMPGEELRTQYPTSELVLEAAKAVVDEVGVERDDIKRLAQVSAFLKDFPSVYWRHVAYRYWIYTCWHQGDIPAMKAAAAAYLTEYPNHPESHGAVSRYYYEADIEPVSGLASAQRSVELYEHELGITGALDSLQRLNAQTSQETPQRDFLPPSHRALFRDYLGSRFNLARYQVAAKQYDAALKQVEPVIALNPLTTEEDQTLAPFYLVAGDAMRESGNQKAAYRYYLGALIVGDSRNRYSIQAGQYLPELEKTLSADDQASIRASFIPAELAGVALPAFTDVTERVGLDGISARRVAWGDVDRDGDADLLADGHTLLRNDGRDGFTDVSSLWGLAATGARGAAGGVFADYDNDGDLDLYSAGSGTRGDRLWRNEGASFINVTPVIGDPTDDWPSEGAAWLDYDSDGLIDLYVANFEKPNTETDGVRGVGYPDRLYRNDGYGRMSLLDPAAAGLVPPFGENLAGRGVSVADYDTDGDQDIFVSDYRLQENLLWRNNGDGTFTDNARPAGAAGWEVEGWFGHTIGSAWGDVDNDGDLDLFSANLAHPRYEYFSNKSMLLISERGADGPRFTDQRQKWGIKYAETHSDPLFFDCNNDGFLDLYITCIYENCRSYLYLNDGHGKFHDVTYLAGAGVLDGWGVACADFDNDGDLDLACGSGGGIVLLRNDTPVPGAWLEVQCEGGKQDSSPRGASTQSNRAAIGARVTVTAGAQSYLREIQSGRGTCSGDELIAHFGLGEYSGPVLLEVCFPSGAVAQYTVEQLNQRVTVFEPVQAAPAEEPPATAPGADSATPTVTPEPGSEPENDALNEDPGFTRQGNSRK